LPQGFRCGDPTPAPVDKAPFKLVSAEARPNRERENRVIDTEAVRPTEAIPAESLLLKTDLRPLDWIEHSCPPGVIPRSQFALSIVLHQTEQRFLGALGRQRGRGPLELGCAIVPFRVRRATGEDRQETPED